MKKPRKSLICIISMAIAVLLIATSGVFANTVFEDTINREEQYAEYALDECAAIEKYNILLDYWSPDGVYISEPQCCFPDFYGGSYLNESKELVIQVTEYTEETHDYFGSIIALDNVVFEEVNYSLNELIRERDVIASFMDQESKDPIISQITGVGLAEDYNSVGIMLASINKAELPDYISEFKQMISSFDGIRFICDCGRCVSTSPEPGDKISTRSVGYWATNASGSIGIVTAGHGLSSGNSLYVNSTYFGSCATSQFGGAIDAAFVPRSNTSFTATNYISGCSRTLKSNTVAALLVGASVYANGYATGIISGHVSMRGFSPSTGLTYTVLTTAVTDYGNSGGIVYAPTLFGNYAKAAGVMSGMVTSNSHMYYTEASSINNALGLSVY